MNLITWSRQLLLLALVLVPLAAVETVSAIYPSSAVAGAATTVVITGTNFTGTPTVTIGAATAGTVTVDSATQITAAFTAQATPLGQVNVVVGGGTLTNGFTVLESRSATLQVTITCNLAQVLALCWTGNTQVGGTPVGDGTTSAVAWSLVNLAASVIRNTDSAATPTDNLDFQVRNVGNGPSHVTVSTNAASTSSGLTWTHAAAVSVDTYALAVSDGMNTATPTWQALTATRTLNSGSTIGVNGLASFDLQFKAPSWDTTLLSQTITVTVTATP